MATDVRTASDRSLTVLVRGILDDINALLKQQMALLRCEIRADLRQTKQAVLSFAVGLGVCVFAGLSLWLMLVHLLHWAAALELPLWACYGITGGTLALVGGVLLYAGARKFQSFNPLPHESVQAMKENLQWMTNPKPSGSR
jgi:hypothetical protein